jgi:isocitrate/isopropylmalate dehydrogenase
VDRVIAAGKHLTGDLGGRAKTTEFGDAVVAAMK